MVAGREARSLTSETVEGLALTLEGVDDIHRGDSLSFGVFAVGDGISDDIFKEDFEDATSFFVDESRDSLKDGGRISGVSQNGISWLTLTPPRRARRRIAGLVIPWMLSRRTLR